MALWKKSFNNLGGTDYVEDARVAENQRQQQITNANQAALRAHQIAQQQLQQQQAAAGWKNKLAADAQAMEAKRYQDARTLEQLKAQFLYGEDANDLRKKAGELPYAQLAEQGRQFDGSLGLDRDKLGLARDRFSAESALDRDKFGFDREKYDYARSMGASPEEAQAMRELDRLIRQADAKKAKYASTDELLSAQERAARIALDPDYLSGKQVADLATINLDLGAKQRADARDKQYGDRAYLADLDRREQEAAKGALALGRDAQFGDELAGLDLQQKRLLLEELKRAAASAPENEERKGKLAELDMQVKEQALREQKQTEAFTKGKIRDSEDAAAATVLGGQAFEALTSGKVKGEDRAKAIAQVMLQLPASRRREAMEAILNSPALLDAVEAENAPFGARLSNTLSFGYGGAAKELAAARERGRKKLEAEIVRYVR